MLREIHNKAATAEPGHSVSETQAHAAGLTFCRARGADFMKSTVLVMAIGSFLGAAIAGMVIAVDQFDRPAAAIAGVGIVGLLLIAALALQARNL
jgi:hypothetical protein